MGDQSRSARLIGVGGGSCSGKTRLAHELAEALGAIVLPIDNYYRDLSHLAASQREFRNFDHPDALEWPLLADHMVALASGEPIAMPEYDFTDHVRRPSGRLIEPTEIVIVEGIFALYEAMPLHAYQFKVFVVAPRAVRLERRILRDARERGRSKASIEGQFQTTVDPMHREHVEPTRANADLVVDGCAPFQETVAEILRRGFAQGEPQKGG